MSPIIRLHQKLNDYRSFARDYKRASEQLQEVIDSPKSKTVLPDTMEKVIEDAHTIRVMGGNLDIINPDRMNATYWPLFLEHLSQFYTNPMSAAMIYGLYGFDGALDVDRSISPLNDWEPYHVLGIGGRLKEFPGIRFSYSYNDDMGGGCILIYEDGNDIPIDDECHELHHDPSEGKYKIDGILSDALWQDDFSMHDDFEFFVASRSEKMSILESRMRVAQKMMDMYRKQLMFMAEEYPELAPRITQELAWLDDRYKSNPRRRNSASSLGSIAIAGLAGYLLSKK